jgi:hypothetical protein
MKPAAPLKFLAFFALLVVASLACQLGGGPPAIGAVVTAKGLDADYKPVDPTSTYSSDDIIYISVETNNLVVGSVVEVKYKLAGADYSNTSLTADKAGSGYFGFKLTAEGGHTPGDYTAEIYLDGKLDKTVAFKIVSSGPPSVIAVLATKTVDADGKPGDPVTTFSPTDTIYVSVQVKNLVVGSKVKVVYTSNGTSQDSTLTADKPGSGYDNFSLTPPAGGNSKGDYKAEVYLDDVLVQTVTFTVK